LPYLKEECGTTPEDLNWNLVYLEKCGYVELGRAHEGVTYIAPSAAMTHSGIDLIEDEQSFNSRFPLGGIGFNEWGTESHSNSDSRCRFCSESIKGKIIEEFDTVFAIQDEYPVTQGHHLVIPHRHTLDAFAMTPKELKDAQMLLDLLRQRIAARDAEVTGFNIGANCGLSAGQTIMHAHIHLIPRRDGDISDPTGGVRGVIPEKRIYKPRET
jgi:diadenosine tetraphosphate (Ap4A) HIT family hydrolase